MGHHLLIGMKSRVRGTTNLVLLVENLGHDLNLCGHKCASLRNGPLIEQNFLGTCVC